MSTFEVYVTVTSQVKLEVEADSMAQAVNTGEKKALYEAAAPDPQTLIRRRAVVFGVIDAEARKGGFA